MDKLSSYKKYLWMILGLFPLLLVSPAQISIWKFADSKLDLYRGEYPGLSTMPVKKMMTADLNGDGTNECLLVAGQQLQITDCAAKVFWESPQTWQVKEAQIGDLNHDGKPEAVLLVWRPFKPWPIDSFVPSGGRIKDFHNKQGLSCHVILIGWKRGGYNEVWAGSSLIRPVEQLYTVDLDNDGSQELVALEGFYDADRPGGELTVWKWNSFGFILADEQKQNYSKLQVIGSDTEKWILVQK
jgi:hypothetical protein